MDLDELDEDIFMFTNCKSCKSMHPIIELTYEDETSTILCLNCGEVVEEEDIEEVKKEDVESLGYTEELILFMLKERLNELLEALGEEYFINDQFSEEDFEETELNL